MDLDEIAVRLRSRDPYEATDLGFAVARTFWRPLYGAWLVCVLPIFAVATGIALWSNIAWAPLLAVWVLKPVYDRVPLYVVSRALFGDVPEVRRTVRRALSGSIWDAALDCTIRRFSPYRGFLLPLRELEGLSGSRYRSRRTSMLRSKVRGPAISMLAVSITFEALTLLASYFTVLLFAPPEFRAGTLLGLEPLSTTGELAPGVIVAAMAAYFVAVSLVEVFYVAGSFGLYINRRIHLEGWDIEIDFKRMARRLGSGADRMVAGLAAAVAAAAAVATLGAPAPLTAEPTPLESERNPGEVADRVLEDDQFGETKEEWVWARKETESREAESGEPSPSLGPAAGALFDLFIWVVVGIGVLVLSYQIVRRAWGSSDTGASDDVVDGPDPEIRDVERGRSFELPTDIVETAVRRWEEGDAAGSLSLLYRGTLRSVGTRYGIAIESDMTARECVRAVERAGGPGDYMSRLGEAWTSTAYADRPPTDEQARELFRTWRVHFSGGAQ